MTDTTGKQSVRFDWAEVDSVTHEVVDAVAAATGEDPMEMKPLAEAIDTDALETLFAPLADGTRRDRGHVRFRVVARDVTVYAHGEIVVHE